MLATMAIAIAALGAACDEPEASPQTVAPDVATVLVELPDATPEQMNAAAEVVRARLQSLDLPIAEVGWDDAAIEVIVSAADEQLARAALAPTGSLEIRPVLSTSETRPDAQVTVEGEDGTVYSLGAVAVTGAALESAAAGRVGSEWTVDPVFLEGPTGIGAFNELAAACDAADAQVCPASSSSGHGMVAILVDGELLSAPSINVDRFERDQIRISGSFDERSARALAAVLDGGAATMAWTVRD
jgi:preprotein translocase subunit SecD